MTIRLVHFSDIHLTANPIGWQLPDWFSKRVTGWLSVHLGRRRLRFHDAAKVLGILVQTIQQRRPDCLVFSGDATMLGFPAELDRVRRLLLLDRPDPPPGIAVPGNHDYYTVSAERSGAFEQTFAPWLQGQRVEDQTYPFARRVGAVWLIGVNTSVGNWIPVDARGWIDPAQLDRLARLLAVLEPGRRILVTHYPVCLDDGRPEGYWHGLQNLGQLLAVARAGGISLWLHGHRHHSYVIANPAIAPFPVICAGSATDSEMAGWHEYAIDGSRLHGLRYRFDRQNSCFRETDRFHLDLPAAVA